MSTLMEIIHDRWLKLHNEGKYLTCPNCGNEEQSESINTRVQLSHDRNIVTIISNCPNCKIEWSNAFSKQDITNLQKYFPKRYHIINNLLFEAIQ